MIKVLKFGGTCLQNQESIDKVVEIIKKYADDKLLIVTSAMGRYPDPYATDTLKSLVSQVNSDEYSRLLSCGEIISSIILSNELKKQHLKAISVSSRQIELKTHKNKLVTRDEIMDYLWESEEFIDDNTLNVNIKRLRTKLEELGLENKIGKTYKLFKLLSENLINVDIIVQSFGEYITKDIAFTVKMNDLEKTLKVLEENKEKLGAKEILHSENLAKVSIIGVGIANKPGVAADMFEALYENNINMHMVTTSEIKISVLVDSNQSDLAVKKIHQKFFGK